MSKVAVTFPDPMLATLDILRAVIPSVTFGTKVYDDVPNAPTPYVMVRLDGSQTRYPAVETASIRIAVWHSQESDGLVLLQQILAVLFAYPGGHRIRSISPRIGSFPTTDPDNGLPLSSATVAVRLRPQTLDGHPVYPSDSSYPSESRVRL